MAGDLTGQPGACCFGPAAETVSVMIDRGRHRRRRSDTPFRIPVRVGPRRIRARQAAGENGVPKACQLNGRRAAPRHTAENGLILDVVGRPTGKVVVPNAYPRAPGSLHGLEEPLVLQRESTLALARAGWHIPLPRSIPSGREKDQGRAAIALSTLEGKWRQRRGVNGAAKRTYGLASGPEHTQRRVPICARVSRSKGARQAAAVSLRGAMSLHGMLQTLVLVVAPGPFANASVQLALHDVAPALAAVLVAAPGDITSDVVPVDGLLSIACVRCSDSAGKVSFLEMIGEGLRGSCSSIFSRSRSSSSADQRVTELIARCVDCCQLMCRTKPEYRQRE